MASFDATSSAVPDSLLLARQADRLARQATNTVMQDTLSRPALGDSSNTLSVEAINNIGTSGNATADDFMDAFGFGDGEGMARR